MSANFIEFMERAAFIDAAGFGLDRQIGLGALYQREHFTLAAGVFGPHPFDEERWFQDVKTGSARVTVAPIKEEGHVLHLGASWRSRGGATDLRAGAVAGRPSSSSSMGRAAPICIWRAAFISTPSGRKPPAVAAQGIFDADTSTVWKLRTCTDRGRYRASMASYKPTSTSGSSVTILPIGATTCRCKLVPHRRDAPL